jgi:surface antigen
LGVLGVLGVEKSTKFLYKQERKMRILIVLMVQLFMISNLFGAAPDFNNRGYKSPLNPFDQWGSSWYECTRYAFGRAYEQTNTVLKFTVSSGRHGGRWYDIVKDLPRGSTPKANSLVVWTYGTYGHVAYVESVSGNSVTFSEANWASPTDGKYKGFKTLTKNQMKNRGGYKLKGYIYLTDNSSTGGAIFNGAGSLVAPNDDCYGCNKDIVQLHRENGIGSVGVFQWLYDEDSCSQLDIYANEDLGDVVIKTKSWGNDYIHKAFKVNLKAWDVVSIKPDDTWTTFAVITQRPLKSTTAQLIAKCKNSSDTFYNANRVSVSTDPVDVTYGYNWTGTGSLITRSNRADNAYGKYKDLANTRTTNSNKAFTTFQWYAKSGCREVVISRDGSNSYAKVNSMAIKGWKQSNEYWKKQNCYSLPCTVSVSSDGYYVLKVATDKNALGGDHMRVQCK